ncbi:long-chain-fatty-acid--CoA ligase [Nitratifractor salsuginis]|uniref:Long-chain-fatty-acid--CoA ligase n=1 Tax=Nitratifractor salsuginis (strain DSM 16511 / JCM 12458 / E9I37-1) TaxID=749222 RepID=E6X2X5_NITSE|nr:long-chain-fatty-acid--CoA ligase [Nitratifractor salsuginis]ADV47258.1 AMP-dependent synthetase and ligase [Nitratifractor salsuginis DSM 16511]
MGALQYRYNNFYEVVFDHGRRHPRRKALFVGEKTIRYGELLKKVDAFAGTLHHLGIEPEDRVALFMRNSWEFIVAVLAISKVGGITVPINTFLKADELSYILEDSGAKILIASAVHEKVVHDSIAGEKMERIIWEGGLRLADEKNLSFEEALSQNLQCKPVMRTLDDLAVFFYTSGTTGKPKGAMLSYKNILSNAESGSRLLHITHRDRTIVFLPMFHAFTFSIGLILPLYVGGGIVIIQSLRPFSNIFKQALLKRVTIFFGVPDVYNALAKAKLPWYFMAFNKIRIFVSGAAPLQSKTLEAMRAKFRRAKMLEGYGLSESSPAVCINPLHKQKDRSVGPAMPGYQVKIVDENMVELPRGEVGEIILFGDNVMQGYLNRPEATAETIINGWLCTGDMGTMDEEGYLYIVDRKKDLIISKGINIYPREIEDLIDRFPGVGASAVIGIPDEKNGEVPVAYIEPEEGERPDVTKLKAHLREHLANFKIPRKFYITEALPKNATGKVLKRVLKEQLLQQENFEE